MNEQMLRESHCIFAVADIEKTAQFYESQLGFTGIKYLDSKEPHICLYRDATEIILIQAAGEIVTNRQVCGYGYDAYFITTQQEALLEEYKNTGVNIVRALGKTDYQNREFVIEDIDGRWIAFGIKEKE